MKFFADTADIDEIRDLAATGLLDGVTTNPSLVGAHFELGWILADRLSDLVRCQTPHPGETYVVLVAP